VNSIENVLKIARKDHYIIEGTGRAPISRFLFWVVSRDWCEHTVHVEAILCLVWKDNMSWDSYIDNLVAQSKDGGGQTHVDKACIIGIDGGAQWTSNDHPSALKVANLAVMSVLCVIC